MQLPVIYVWTHDSIGLGEDGPTHQPIEHLAALRAIPGPRRRTPGRRQRDRRRLADDPRAHRPPGRARAHPPERADLPARRGRLRRHVRRRTGAATCSSTPTAGARRRAHRHRLGGPAGRGSPRAPRRGRASGLASCRCRAVSGSTRQDAAYRDTVIPPTVQARVSVEAGVAQGWREVVGDAGRIVSIEHYGASADFDRIYQRVRHHRGGRRRRSPGQHRAATG